jgi:hypothetical protein
MPFDTTYNISTYDKNLSGTVTFPGGKDTTITLEPWQLPSTLDYSLAGHDGKVYAFQTTLRKEAENKRHFNPDFEFVFIFLAVFGFIIYKFWKKSEVTETYSQAIFTDKAKPKKKDLLVFYGDELYFSDQQVATILTLSLLQQTFANLENHIYTTPAKFHS